MRAQLNLRPGTCFLCHQSVAKPHAARHVAACLKARPLGSGERRPALRLAVEGRYLAEYTGC